LDVEVNGSEQLFYFLVIVIQWIILFSVTGPHANCASTLMRFLCPVLTIKCVDS
jgi:hypothetical protein